MVYVVVLQGAIDGIADSAAVFARPGYWRSD
jgi:hypothetical protein